MNSYSNYKHISILLTLNTYYSKYSIVMLTSLFMNNSEARFDIYVMYSELSISAQQSIEEMVKAYGNRVFFLRVDKSNYDGFPTSKALTVECYFVCLAHLSLPESLERILYLDSDIIVDGSITELYEMDFEDNYLIACGQSFEKINGNYYRLGARAERGEKFNSGVMLYNLRKMRQHISANYIKSIAKDNQYSFLLADQGLLNIVYEKQTKIIDSYYYNFRISLMEDQLRYGESVHKGKPVIFHYVSRDYYRLGISTKPWTLMLTSEEYEKLYECGIIKRLYIMAKADSYNMWMQQHWWDYAKKTSEYNQLLAELNANKEIYMERWIGDRETSLKDRLIAEKKRIRKILEDITDGNFDEFDADITFSDLEDYIDEIESEKAISTMNNLFEYDFQCLRKKTDCIKVAFVVYSSAEWQCESLYRLFENDDRIVPVLAICGYHHGTDETIRDTYVKTCNYFRHIGTYNIEYLGYSHRRAKVNQLDKYDILFYTNPFENALNPYDVNIGSRRLRQLLVYIPYGVMLEDKRDLYYAPGYYDLPAYKLSWKYFAEDSYSIETANKEARLGSYNVEISGFPKIDELLEKSYKVRPKIWKIANKCEAKIIWAPHFNLIKGMNGTFYENYEWFFNYAKEHKEISWVIRPHPRMASGVTEKGIFNSVREYYEYLGKWDKLPNAQVIESGGYYDIFDSSDAIIHDCLSFIYEYLFTGKPMLRLVPEEDRLLNERAFCISKYIYSERGNNYDAIEEFINNVKHQIDSKRDIRLEFIRTNLDYRSFNGGKSASRYIFDAIKKQLGEC